MAESNILNFFKEIPESTITALRDIHADGNNSFSNVDNTPFAGICLSPQRALGSSDEKTVSFLIHIVGFNENDQALVMYTSTDLLTANVGKNAGSQVAFTASTFELSLAGSSNMSLADRFFYNDSVEFDFAFIDAHILENFLTSSSYYNNIGGVLKDKDGHDVINRSIRIERALVQFNRPLISLLTGSASGVVNYYRTLKVQPWPEPVLVGDELRTGAVAYHVVPTCPPFWKASNTSAEKTANLTTTALSEESAEAMASKKSAQQENRPEQPSKKQVTQPSGENKTSPVFLINQEDMRKYLIENGYIPKERSVYKIKLWPIILGILAIVIGLVGTGVLLSRTKIF